MKHIKTRVIPILLLETDNLVKTTRFKNPTYIGDPINSVRIFNEKEVDELVIFDISASIENRQPNLTLLQDITSEAFMPMAYGGGISTLEQIQQILCLGFEKIIINSAIYSNPKLITEAASIYGSQSIAASVDVKRSRFLGRYQLVSHSGKRKHNIDLISHIKHIEQLGAGEIIINSVDRDGTQSGYDLELIHSISKNVKIPIVASGGASSVKDFKLAIEQAGASAVAAGSFFVFMGPHRAVLINYPSRETLTQMLP